MSLNTLPGGVTPVSAVSSGAQAAPAPMSSHFTQIWNDAKSRYEKDTGHDIDEAPFAAELSTCVSVDDIIQVLDKRDEAFEAFRAHGKEFRKVINPIFRIVQLFLETGAEVAVVVGHVNVLSVAQGGSNLGIWIDWCPWREEYFRCIRRPVQSTPWCLP